MRIEDCHCERYTRDLLYSDDFLRDGIMLTPREYHSEESPSRYIDEGTKTESVHF